MKVSRKRVYFQKKTLNHTQEIPENMLKHGAKGSK